MRSSNQLAVALGLLGVLWGCGGGGSTSPTAGPQPTPTPTPPPVFEVFDGVTGAPVTPRLVTPTNPQPGEMVTVELDGYLVREQQWTGPGIMLWPLPTVRSAETTLMSLVYGPDSARNLSRWDPGSYEVVFEQHRGSEQDGRDVVEAMTQAFEEIASAGGPSFTWSTTDGSGGLDVPGGPALKIVLTREFECLDGVIIACANWWWDGGTIKRAEVAFETARYGRDKRITKHMMGLLIGLGRHYGGGVLNHRYRDRHDAFSGFEREAIHMMYQHRRVGNAAPDRDPGFSASGGAGVERRVERGPDL